MKKLLITLFGIVALAGMANAQTYVRYSLTNFAYFQGAMIASTNIVVSSNTLVQVKSILKTTYVGAVAGWQFYGGPVVYTDDTNAPILGPCTLILTACLTTQNPYGVQEADVIVQYQTVNVAPSAVGVLQVPNNTVNVALQSSADLTTWSTATNGTYGGTDQYRFFRVGLK